MRVYLTAIFAVFFLGCGGGGDESRNLDAGIDARIGSDGAADTKPAVASDAHDAPVRYDSGAPDRPVDSVIEAGGDAASADALGHDGGDAPVAPLTEIYLYPSTGEFRTCVGRESEGIEFRTRMPEAAAFRPYQAVIQGGDSHWTIRTNTCVAASSAGSWCSIVVVFRPNELADSGTVSLTVSDSAGLLIPDTVLLRGIAEACD